MYIVYVIPCIACGCYFIITLMTKPQFFAKLSAFSTEISNV